MYPCLLPFWVYVSNDEFVVESIGSCMEQPSKARLQFYCWTCWSSCELVLVKINLRVLEVEPTYFICIYRNVIWCVFMCICAYVCTHSHTDTHVHTHTFTWQNANFFYSRVVWYEDVHPFSSTGQKSWSNEVFWILSQTLHHVYSWSWHFWAFLVSVPYGQSNIATS